jgi:mono/diheme cytochrome c family protein
MSDQEIQTVVDYFDKVLRSDAIDSLQITLDDPNLVGEGKGLFFEKYGCQSCHQVGGTGGYVGPPLDRTGERLTAGWVYLWIRDPQKYYPDTLEPNAGLSDHEARAITSYLMSLKGR